jgi:hypothetical protein
MKKIITFILLAFSFVLGGCGNDESNEIVGTWKGITSAATGYSYVTETYTSDYFYETCRYDNNDILRGCAQKLTYRLENGKIIKSNGTSVYYSIVEKDKKKYLRCYHDATKDSYYDLEKID